MLSDCLRLQSEDLYTRDQCTFKLKNLILDSKVKVALAIVFFLATPLKYVFLNNNYELFSSILPNSDVFM